MTTLLVASTGGHLSQLQRLWPQLRAAGLSPDPIWLTFDTPQSRSSLRDQQVEFLRYVAPRDVLNVVRNMRAVRRILNDNDVTAIASTGSGIALSVLPLARAHGVPSHYIESAARSEGPSLTGRLVSRIPGVNKYAQYESWATPEWRYAGSIFDQFRPSEQHHTPVKRVLVTLGTIPYGFARLVDRVLDIAPPGVQITWQLGATKVAVNGSAVYESVPQDDLREMASAADVVIAHSGIGSALMALECGRMPLLIPRAQAHAEHVDDHQAQIAADLERRGLAFCRTPLSLDWETVLAAAAGRVEAVSLAQVDPFPLVASRPRRSH